MSQNTTSETEVSNIIIHCDISSPSLLRHFNIKFKKWTACINQNKQTLCRAVRAALISHISKCKGFETIKEETVSVDIKPVAAPPRPPRVPKVLADEFKEVPLSRERHQYWLTRTSRLAQQAKEVCENTRGSGMIFFQDTLAIGYGRPHKRLREFYGELQDAPERLKTQLDNALVAIATWATLIAKDEANHDSNWDIFEQTLNEFKILREMIQDDFKERRITEHDRRTRLSKLVFLLREKAIIGSLFPEAAALIEKSTTQLQHEAIHNEDIEMATESNLTSALESFDVVVHRLKQAQKSKIIDQAQFEQRICRLGKILEQDWQEGSLFNDRSIQAVTDTNDSASTLVEDLEGLYNEGNEIRETRQDTKTIKALYREFETVSTVLERARDINLWAAQTEFEYGTRIQAVENIFKEKLWSKADEPKLEVLINDINQEEFPFQRKNKETYPYRNPSPETKERTNLLDKFNRMPGLGPDQHCRQATHFVQEQRARPSTITWPTDNWIPLN